MNTDLKKKLNMTSKKIFFKVMNNAVFRKAMEKVRKHRDKYGEKTKLCYMDTDNFIAYIKTDDIYKDIGEDLVTRFDTSNNELDRSLPKGKNKEEIALMKYELVGKIMIKFVGLRAGLIIGYIIHDSSEDKNPKGTKKCALKRKLKFEKYKNCLKLNLIIK